MLKNISIRDIDLEKKGKEISLLFKGTDVDEFEIYITTSLDNEIEVFNGSVESLSHSDTSGVGIRLFKDKKMGYAWINSFDEGKIKDCIEKAVLNSKASDADEFNGLPGENEGRYSYDNDIERFIYSDDFFKYTIDEKINMLKRLEYISKSKDKRIIGVDSLSYSDVMSKTTLVNSKGLCRSLTQTSSFVFINLISNEKEDTSTGFSFDYGRDMGSFDLEKIADEAVKKSTALLGGKKIKSRLSSVILDPITASQFLGVFASAITADSVQKGKSLFKDKIGEKLFGTNINIYDDGVMKKGLYSRPFDSEGINKGRTLVCKDGVLKTFLYDSFTARKDGLLSTGNAVRGSYSMPPSVGISNFYIEPSKYKIDAILENIDDGFYVMDVIGMHSGANPVSGDLSVGAKGILIKKGSFSNPVKEVTIASDILSFCSKIEQVADDLRFFPSSGFIGSPSLVIKDIAISGN